MIALSGVRRSWRSLASASASPFLRTGLALDQPIDEAVQLPGCGADPLQVGLHIGQTEIPRLLEQQLLKTQDRSCRAGQSLLHVGGDGLALKFVPGTHFASAA